METKKINLFVFDTPENYEKSKRLLGAEKVTFKSMHRIEGLDEFQSILGTLEDEDLIFIAVHVFSTDGVRGVRLFISSGLMSEFPNLGFMYISEGNTITIKHMMVDAGLDTMQIYKYHEVQSELKSGLLKVLTKRQLMSGVDVQDSKLEVLSQFPQFDYAIITALYKDEFEEVEKIFEFPKDGVIVTGNKDYRIGFLKADPSKRVIAAFQNSTGMVEAGILATHMIEIFKPKYLIMSGVCGGTPDSNFGDIIIAKQVFTFQKGKISDVTYKDSNGEFKNIDLFNREGEIVDYDQLYDNNGNQIHISIEKFEREQDSVINLNTKLEDTLNINLKKIEARINSKIEQDSFFKSQTIKAVIEPMACSTMVINKEGFFEDTIKGAERKTAAVEMESYGVARACHFGNNGRTIPIIFKSVMDHTKKKDDVVNGINWKKFAAFTSAQFLSALFEENII
ncbi:MAG: hypothetical protein V4594_24705 [Bacteroidota bacterium]